MEIFYLDLCPDKLENPPGKGFLNPSVIVIGLAPSTARPTGRRNEPFGSRSYELLQALLEGQRYYVTNLIKIPLPAKTTPKKKLLKEAEVLLKRELELILGESSLGESPRVLVFGAHAAQALIPNFSSLREDHGTLFSVELPSGKKLLVMPTFHPASVYREPTRRQYLKRDLERFMKIESPTPHYWEDYSSRRLKELIDLERRDHPGEELLVFLDIETTGLSPLSDWITFVGLLVHRSVFPLVLKDPGINQLSELVSLLSEEEVCLVGHNLAFDLSMLTFSIQAPLPSLKTRDTMVMAHVLGEPVLALKHLTSLYTERPGSRAFGNHLNLDYLAEDLFSTRELYDLFWQQTSEKSIISLLNGLIPYLVKMRFFGVKVDQSKLEELIVYYTSQIQAARENLNLSAGREINWNSPAQVVDYLLKTGTTLTEKTAGGSYSVKEAVLAELAEEDPAGPAAGILRFRGQEKELSFLNSYHEFLKKSPSEGFLHPHMVITGTETGRLSCRDPNLQQVPRIGPIKQIFCSRWEEGYIGLIDLSQAELRVAALLSSDKKFSRALLSGDVHRTIASLELNIPEEEVTPIQRKKSKAVTFGLLYGGTPKGLAQRAGIEVSEIEKILDRFYHQFPDLMRWLKTTGLIGVNTGEITTIFGRMRSLKELLIKEGPNSVERKAVNTPVQATASDIMLHILLYVFKELERRNLYSSPIFGVHDSTLLDIFPPELIELSKIVNEGFDSLNQTVLSGLPLWGILPIQGELVVGKSWATVESTNENYSPIETFPASSGVRVLLDETKDYVSNESRGYASNWTEGIEWE